MEKIEEVVDILFRTQQDSIWEQPTVNNIPEFTLDELKTAIGRIKSGRAPEPDGISPEVMKIVASKAPEYVLEVKIGCLRRGIFPEKLKVAKLVLLSKHKNLTNEAAGFRPLCLLALGGKLLEQLLVGRIRQEMNLCGTVRF